MEEAATVSSIRIRLVVAGIVCTLVGAFAAALYAVYFSSQPGQDWMVYYSAAQAYLDGNLPLIFDGDRLTAYMNAYFADWLQRPLTFHPWLYPPPYLLILIPFGLMSFAASYPLFQLVTFGCLATTLWAIAQRGLHRWLLLFSLVLSPAATFTMGLGQNSFLTTALLVGGFGLIGRSPVVAGVLLGILTFKPQLWLLVPIALIAAREWRVLAITIVAAGLFALASLAVFGIEPWRVWIEWVVHPPAEAFANYQKWNHLNDESIYTNLFLLGVPAKPSQLGQAVAGCLAVGCVWLAYRRTARSDLQLVVLLAATALAAPHVANYDMVMVAVAATLLFVAGLTGEAGRGAFVIPLLAWVIQLFNPPGAFALGFVTPLLTCGLIACAMVPLVQLPGRATPAQSPRAFARPEPS